MAEELEVELIFDPVFGNQFRTKVTKESAKIGKASGKKFNASFVRATSGLAAALSGVSGQLVAVGAAFSAAFAFKGLIGAAKEVEKLETSLTVLLGSANAAKNTLKDLQEFAAETPFQLSGIASAASQLLAFGISQDKIIPKLKNLGDVAAGSNTSLEEVALIFGQVSAAGKLTGERLLQLQERAIPIGPALAKSLGVAESQVKDLVSSGKIGFAEFEAAFESLSREGGLFEGALSKQSKTIGGVLSTLGDNFFNLQVELGKTFGPAIISSAETFITIFKGFADRIKADGPLITDTISKLTDFLLITPSKFWVNFFGDGATTSLSKVNEEMAAIKEQIASTQRLLSKVPDNFVSRFFGAKEDFQQEIVTLKARLIDLEQIKLKLLDVNKKEKDSSLETSLALKKEREERERQLELEKKQAELRAGLGQIGLTREQVIRENAAKDLEALKNARTQEAITEEEFRQRKLVREKQFAAELAGLRGKESQQIINGLTAQETAQVNSEQTIGDSLSNLNLGFKSYAKGVKQNSIQISGAIAGGIGNAATSAFSAFGRALVTGENALEAFGKALLNAFGQALVQQGSGFILQGIAQSLAGFGSGGPLIAAGAAMVTFGSALSALSGGGGGGAPTGAGGGVAAAPTGGAAAEESTIAAQQEEREEPETRIALTVNGDVFDSQDTGIRISEILSETFNSNGIQISNGSFV